VLNVTGRKSEALSVNKKAVEVAPQDPEGYSNLGFNLQELGHLEEAEATLRQAIALNSEYAEAWNNLGLTLFVLNRIEEAENALRECLKLNPLVSKARSNLALALLNQGRLEESEKELKKSILLDSSYCQAYVNLSNALAELGRPDDAEKKLRQALKYNYIFGPLLLALGFLLSNQGRVGEAEVNLKKAIIINPADGLSLGELGCVRHAVNDFFSSVKMFRRSFECDCKSQMNEVRYLTLKSRLKRKEQIGSTRIPTLLPTHTTLKNNLMVLNRTVETQLLEDLYSLAFRTLDITKDARFGAGKCSLDFNLFELERGIIKTVAEDLVGIMSEAVNSEIYVFDSFFNILGAGGGTHPHNHLKPFDEKMDLGKNKYSLVYYLSVGDQQCSEPGILKLYDPDEEILPSEGTIIIIPADRLHSAIYGGIKDRVMIGVNFYAI
jgi:Flp pilus assembly protein TadD